MKRHARRAGAFVRAHHSKVTAGAKGTAVSALVGTAAYFATQYAAGKVDFLAKNWYAPPAALIVAGHFLKRRYPAIGNSLAAVGGYVGGLSYATNKAIQAAQASQAKGLLGVGEAGELGVGEAGMLVTDNIGTSAAPRLEPGAGMLYEQSRGAAAYDDAYDLQA
jgi:hypothetical protein